MSKLLRILAGFAAAWGSAVVVAVLVGCASVLFAVKGGNAGQVLKAAAFGDKDALNFFLLVGMICAMVAAVVAFLAAIFIGLPLYLASRKLQHVTLRHYLMYGFGIALVVSGFLIALQQLVDGFPVPRLFFEHVAIITAGPTATLTFWAIVRPDRADSGRPAGDTGHRISHAQLRLGG